MGIQASQEARDTHARLSDTTWGVEWARARLAAGTPVILECYMHKLSHEERLEQIAWLTPADATDRSRPVPFE
jgi:hypothetical protein